MKSKIAEKFEAIRETEITSNVKDIDSVGEDISFNINELNECTFKKLVMHYDSGLSSPTEYLVTSTLAALSGAIGRNVYIPITNNINIYLNVWAVLIGPSTIMMKSTAINVCTSDLQKITKKMFEKYQKEYLEYQRQYNQEKDGTAKLSIPVPQQEQIIYPQDTTVEALTDILAVNSMGLMVHNEFGSFLKNLNKSYSGDAKQFLTNTYDVPGTHQVSRVTKQKALIVKPYLSILAASTIDWIQENSSPSDLRSGFLARFIYSIKYVPEKEYTPLFKLKYKNEKSDLDTMAIYEYLVNINEPHELEIDQDAEDLFTEYEINSHEKLKASESDAERSFKARLLVYTLKFAGIIAVSDRRFVIRESDIEDGILLAEYYKKNAEKLLYSEMMKTEFSRQEETIYKLIKKHSNKGMTSHSVVLPFTKFKASYFNELIENLKEKEIIELVPKEECQRIYPGTRGKYYRILQ